MVAHVHKQIAEIAKGICGELYERLMGEDRFYEAWKKQNPDLSSKQLEALFIKRNWHNCVNSARNTLVNMLTDPSVTEAMKEEVANVLIMDRSLVRGRGTHVGRASNTN
jgi:hypothetical protein